MNFIRFAMLAVCCSLITGCQSTPRDTAPSAGMGDWYPAPMNDPQIAMLSPELRSWLLFQPAIVVKDGLRPMSVEIPLRNTTYNKYLIEYRVIFHDDMGREVTPVMGWEFQAMEPKQIVRLKRSALSENAETYRLEVKWAR